LATNGRAFFTEGGEDSSEALDAKDIATTRAELQKLYLSNFGGIDPGIVAADMGRADTNRPLPILDRFVEPEVEVADTGGPIEGAPGKCYAGEYRAGWRKMIIR
jgi:hypothetical protein